MKKYFVLGIACLCNSSVWAQSHTEKITKEFGFDTLKAIRTLIVANINGNISVDGGETGKVFIEAEKIISADSEEMVEKGRKEISLRFAKHNDTLLVYIDTPCPSFGKKRKKDNKWEYNWDFCNCNNDSNDREDSYHYKVDFAIKVPKITHVIASTINEGDVHIKKIEGPVHASNVNGSITLKSISGETQAHTINGDVDLDYTQNPVKDCKYYTLNGDINANFVKGLQASLRFESFNGNFFTNIQQLESLPAVLEKNETHKGLQFKVGGSRYRVGKGGVGLDFETFNGNVYLKEKIN